MDREDQFIVAVIAFFASGMASEILFRRTQIPDGLWLILIGIIAGPILGWVDAERLSILLPYFAPVALIVILFDGGSKLRLGSLRSTVGRSTLLALSTFAASSIVVALASWSVVVFSGLLPDWTWTKALILGCILGGSSSIVIMPTMQLAKVDATASNLVSMESAITDALCIVGTSLIITLALNMHLGALSGGEVATLFSKTIGVGFVAGVLSGALWLIILPFLKGPYNYPTTIMFLFLLYLLTKNLGGSPAFAVLLFSIILGNSRFLGKLLRFKGQRELDHDLKTMHSQISFLVKTFFFILIGVMFNFSLSSLVIALLLTALIALVRFPAVALGLKGSEFDQQTKNLAKICLPRGLAAGVLATMPLQMGIKGMERLSAIVFTVVSFSCVIFAVLFYRARRKLVVTNPSLAQTDERKVQNEISQQV